LAADPATAAAADAAKQAFSQGTSYSAYVAAAFLVIGLIATLSLRNRRPQDGPTPDPAVAAS